MPHWTVRVVLSFAWMGMLGCGGGDPGAEPGDAAARAFTGSGWVPATSGWATIEHVSDTGDCQGVVPSQVAGPVQMAVPVTPMTPPPTVAVCRGGLTDGTGHVALSGVGTRGLRWATVNPDGTLGTAFLGGEGLPLLPQAAGWAGMHATVAPDGSVGTMEMCTIAPAGAVVSHAAIAGDHLNVTEDPAGGSLVTSTIPDGDPGDPNHGLQVIGQRFDASGAPRWASGRAVIGTVPGPVGADFFVGTGISTGGESLTVWGNRGVVTLVWRDAAGHQLSRTSGRETVAAVAGSDPSFYRVELQQMLDGSLALKVNRSWRRIFTRLATSSSPLPDWLSEHLDWSYRVTRGGRGYVILPTSVLGVGTYEDCKQELVLASRNGRLCGRIVLHTVHGNGVCNPGAVDQGWDGTLVRQHNATHAACAYLFWPRALAP